MITANHRIQITRKAVRQTQNYGILNDILEKQITFYFPSASLMRRPRCIEFTNMLKNIRLLYENTTQSNK